MSDITVEQLRSIMLRCPVARATKFCASLNAAMSAYDISSAVRRAAFLAQLAHESGELRYVQEIASGRAYEGRKDLGNTQPGDGVRFKGRGLIQITGRANYKTCGAALGQDLIASPALLETPDLACRSAAWFWDSRQLNTLADEGKFVTITRRINGGINGLSDRQAYWARAKRVLGVEAPAG